MGTRKLPGKLEKKMLGSDCVCVCVCGGGGGVGGGGWLLAMTLVDHFKPKSEIFIPFLVLYTSVTLTSDAPRMFLIKKYSRA